MRIVDGQRFISSKGGKSMTIESFEEFCANCGQIVGWEKFISFGGCCCQQCSEEAQEEKQRKQNEYINSIVKDRG